MLMPLLFLLAARSRQAGSRTKWLLRPFRRCRWKPANHAAMVLSDLLTRADKRAADLTALADKSRIAGLACEAAYDGLSKGLINSAP